ncbi:MAG: DMT family transporter [Pseudomonadota bacterium]
MASSTPQISAQAWALLLLLSLLWGGSFFFVEVAIGALPPLTVAGARVGLAAAILLAVLRLTGRALPRRPGLWAAFLVMGLMNNVVPFSLIAWGQVQIASALAAVLNATTPLFGVLVAHLATANDRLTRRRAAGTAIGFAGAAVMLGGELTLSDLGGNGAAQLACLGASLSYACAGVFARRFAAAEVPPMVTATGQVCASTLLLCPAIVLIDRPWALPVPGWEVWASLVGVAALSTAMAYILYFRILALAGASNLLLVTFLIPISAIALGVGFLDERLSTPQLFGMALIFAGLAVIDGRALVWLRSHRA